MTRPHLPLPVARGLGLAMLSIAVGVSAMCGDSTPSPSPVPKILTSVELVGPSTVTPGESVQFSVHILYSDGSRGDSALPVTWRSSNTQVLSTTTTGLATGGQTGQATLTAQVGNRGASREVVVVPAGTYRLDGVVTETGFPSYFLTNVTVKVLSGLGAGTSVRTTGDGRYSLFGVAGPLQLSVEREGYVSRVLDVDVNAHRKLDVDLAPKEMRPDVSGTYTMSLVAAPECRSVLPEPAWERRYSATAAQVGPNVTVTLGGATFATVSGVIRRTFHGVVTRDRLTVWLGTDFYYSTGADLVETLAADAYYAPVGTAVLTATPGEMRGGFDGSITIYRSVAQSEAVAQCSSANHQVVLSR